MAQNQMEMEQRLKEAGLYEEDMPDEQMKSYYDAITASERSATELQNQSMNDSVNELLTAMNESENNVPSVRERLEQESQKVFTPKQWITDRSKKTIVGTSNQTESSDKKSLNPKPQTSEKVKRNILTTIKSSESNINEKETTKEINKNTLENDEPSEPARVVEDDEEFFRKLDAGEDQDSVFEKLKNSGIKIQPVKITEPVKITDPFKNINHIGFNDMPESVCGDRNMLKILCHQLKVINIQNSKKFLSSTRKERIQMLFDYHVASEKLRAQIARMSNQLAPLPKLITNIDSQNLVVANGSSEDNSPIHPTVGAIQEEENAEGIVMFVSRSGRHTKRKIYSEDDSPDFFNTSSKKSKTNNNEEWTSSKSVGVAKVPLIKKSDSVSSTTTTTSNNNNNDKDFIVEEVPKRTSTRPTRKLHNHEIMQRCPTLFRDLPNKKRAGAMVTAGIDEENRRRLEAEKMEQFDRSLSLPEENSDDVITLDEDRPDEEVAQFERKRVVPPLPGRRPINNRKRKEDGAGAEPLGITTAKKPASNISSSSDEFQIKPVNGSGNGTNGNNRPHTRQNSKHSTEKSEASSSTSRHTRNAVQTEDMVPCPLCDHQFPKDSIQEHASTCGEEVVTQSTPKNSRITCPICDSVIVKNYQEHVTNCL